MFLRLQRLLELEASEWKEPRWKRILYWIVWLAMACLAVALLLARLNGALMSAFASSYEGISGFRRAKQRLSDGRGRDAELTLSRESQSTKVKP